MRNFIIILMLALVPLTTHAGYDHFSCSIQDAYDKSFTSTYINGHQALDVNVIQSVGGGGGGDIGGLTDAELRASAVPVSGAFPTPIPFPASYPITTVSPIPITGTFPTPPSVQIVAVPSPVVVTGSFPTPPPSQAVTGAFPTPPASQVVTGSFPTPIPFPTVPVTGSATINGSAPIDSYISSGIYFSATPTPTPGKTYPLSLDASGDLYVKVSNPTAFPTPSSNQAVTLSAETSKVIGTVNIASAQTVGLAAGSQVVGHVIVDTAPTTAVTLASAPTTAVTMAAASISGSNPCVNPTATLVSLAGATSTTNATQIIALSGTTKIYICSLTVIGVSGTTPTFSLVQGTGSNCVTGQTTVVHAFGTTANQSYLFSGPIAVGAAGAELCYKDGGTSPVENYQLTYVQQ